MNQFISATLLLLLSTSVHSITITQAFVGNVNSHRKSLGLNPLILNSSLSAIARIHSSDMAFLRVSFGHSGFSVRCNSARKKLGGGNLCAENVAVGQTSGKKVFSSWMESVSHRKSIESSRLTHMGFAYVKNESGKYYWTNLFLERR